MSNQEIDEIIRGFKYIDSTIKPNLFWINEKTFWLHVLNKKIETRYKNQKVNINSEFKKEFEKATEKNCLQVTAIYHYENEKELNKNE